jgi:hypothetical protein
VDEPQVTCPEDWTQSRSRSSARRGRRNWATRKYRPIWLAPGPEAKRRQQVTLHLTWTEDGEPREELFGPWTQGDPETDGGSVAHLMAAHGFVRERCRMMGREPDEAVLVVILDPEQWLRERGQQQKGSDDGD